MNKQSITFSASEQTLEKLTGDDQFASNTVSYVEATFTLGTNWAGFDSVRAVWKSQHYEISMVLDQYGKCDVPAEVMYYKSKVFVNLVGVSTSGDEITDRLTTYPTLAFTIDSDSAVEGTETTDITPSQFDQFVSQVSDDASAAAASAAAAAASAASLTVDSALSNSSTNPVQNKVINGAITDLKEESNYNNYATANINDELHGKHPVYVDYKIGRYAVNGYDLSVRSYVFSSVKYPAGTYSFPEPPEGYDYAVVQYVSDSSGTNIVSYRDTAFQNVLPENSIICMRKQNGQNFTEQEATDLTYSFNIYKIEAPTGISDDVEAMKTELAEWEPVIFGEDNPEIQLDLVQGYYLSGGFGGSSSRMRWRTANAFTPGTYQVINTTGTENYIYYWVDYVSDSSGTVIYNSRSASATYTDSNSFYLTFAKTDNSDITADEIKANFKVIKVQESNSIEAKVNRLYSGQKVVFMGDSIFGMERSNTSIPSLCGYYTGATIYNCAIGGSTACERQDNYTYYSFSELSKAIVNGDFTNQIAHQSDTGNPEYLPDVVAMIQDIDFSTIDIICITYGGNDYAMSIDDASGFAAAMEAGINRILTEYNNIRFLLMTPPYKFFLSGTTFVDDGDDHLNGFSETLRDYVNSFSTISTACHVPFVNAYDDLGIGKYNRSQWFNANDGSHPNETGRMETAKLVSEYLKRMLYN